MKFLPALLLPLSAGADSGPAAASDSAVLRVQAASSLTNVFDELGALWTQQGGMPVRFSYAASSTLARQLDAGARPEAAQFLAFLKSPAAQAVFRKYGFSAPPP